MRRNWILQLSLGLLLATSWAGCQSTRPELPTSNRAEASKNGAGFTLTETVQLDASARATFGRSVEALQRGENGLAVELLEPLSNETDAPISVFINLGIAYRETDELDKSAETLRRAVERNPTHPVALNELGITLRRQGRFDEAREQYEAALRIQPEFHFARKNLAILCDLYLSDLVCALNHYRQYAAADPTDEAARIWISDLENRVHTKENSP
jgi:Flp pilus assembly protein TadD